MTAEQRKERERIAAEFRPVVLASLKTFPLLKAFTEGLMAHHLLAPSSASRTKGAAPKRKAKETRR
ncbi:MAG: hypothetical protein HC794_05660 [Nitrospiraceae bacterium]|nr:hypothetical protein [Nitrospiraceae bacterium]